MSELDQIRQNAAWVVRNLGPESGLAQFAYNAESVSYVDAYIRREIETIKSNEQSIQRFVDLFGAFLGESIISTYGGVWDETQNEISVILHDGCFIEFIHPFREVQKCIANGDRHSLNFYFTDYFTSILSEDDQPTLAKKPWWKRR